MDCFGAYFTHVQTCDNVRVQPTTQWTASELTLHMSKPVITFVFKVLCNGLLRYILYTCPNRDKVHVQSATQWTASVHTLHMSKPVTTFVFKVLQRCYTSCQSCFETSTTTTTTTTTTTINNSNNNNNANNKNNNSDNNNNNNNNNSNNKLEGGWGGPHALAEHAT